MAFLNSAILAVGYRAGYALMAVRVTLSGAVTTADGMRFNCIYVLYMISSATMVTSAGT